MLPIRIAFWIVVVQAVYARTQSIGPHIIRGPRSANLRLGRTATLLCRTVGTPRPEITWFFNGNVLAEKTSKLKIKDFSPKNAGIYWCSASNAAGTVVSRNATIRYHGNARKESWRLEFQCLFVKGLPDGFEKNPANVEYYTELLTGKPVSGTAVFKCTIAAVPFGVVPDISWERKKGKQQWRRADSGRFYARQYGRRSILQISPVEKGDFEAEFVCIATNKSTTVKSSSARLKSTSDPLKKNPTFTEKPFNVSVAEGKEAVLGCSFSGNVRNFAWHREMDGKPTFVASEKRGRNSLIGQHNFYIESARLSDAGWYTCSAESILTKAKLTASAFLSVVVEPEFEETPSQAVTAITGLNVELKCRARGWGVSINWLKNGKPITFDGRRVKKLANNYNSLSLNPVENDDGGMYQCYIENEFGEGKQSATHLVVEYPAFVTVPSQTSIVVMEDENVTLLCSADGNPSDTIEFLWEKNGEKISISSTGNLTISNAKPANSGEYECIPSNRHGTTSTAIVLLTVKSKWTLQPPVVTTTFPVLVVNQSDPITINCAVEYFNESVRVSWSRDSRSGEDLLDDYVILNKTRTLHIPSAAKHHAGVYICTVETELGSSSAQVNVTVQYPPKNSLPPPELQFLRIIPNEEVPALRCSSFALPPPTFTWEKDGEELNGKGVRVEDQTSVLQLENLNGSESVGGVYTCRARNPLGSSETKFTVEMIKGERTEAWTQAPTKFSSGKPTSGGLIADSSDLYIIIGCVVGGILLLTIFLIFCLLCCC